MKITLQKGKEEAILRKHHWIFSGAIARIEGNKDDDGALVSVYNHAQQFLAHGHYATGSIAVRILSFLDTPIDLHFWHQSILRAYTLRQHLGLTDNPNNNAYRLVHGEGDGLPGLIIDYYKNTLVIQAHTMGMYRARNLIVEALRLIPAYQQAAIYDKSKDTIHHQNTTTSQPIENTFISGTALATTITENGYQFNVNWHEGQKTGFFLDQRNNRQLLTQYAANKSVLNAFCYSGGFSVYALGAGATTVHSVDASAKAIDWTNENVQLNSNTQQGTHKGIVADVMQFLKSPAELYDVIILDPPAFAKSIHNRHQAVQGYKRLNVLGFKAIKPHGILFTFSCSQVVDNRLFQDTITAAAIEAGRNVRILHHLEQPADHPVNIFHPEGSYLKGLVLYVE
jgi:23S rRNA (cytosine1962-C5)-methyltransferase